MATLVSKDLSGVLQAGPGETEVLEARTRCFKQWRLPPGSQGSHRVGGDVSPIHYRLDPFNEAEQLQEIDLDLVPGAACDYQCLTNGYQVELWNSRQNTSGDTLRYVARFTRAGKWFMLAPIALYWENDRGQRQTIGTLQPGITPVVDNNAGTITWPAAFGPGLHFRYNLSPDRFAKTLVVDSLASLPPPTIQNRNTRLVLLMSLSWDQSIIPSDQRFPAGFLPGELSSDASKFYVWQASVDSPTSFSFNRNDEHPVFWWQTPRAWDANQLELPGYFWQVGISTSSQYGAKFCVPWASLQTSSYPLSIDTAIGEELTIASADDASGTGAVYPGTASCSLTGTTITVGKTSGGGGLFQMLGARFQGVPIPNGAQLVSAALSVKADAAGTNPTNLRLWGYDIDSSAAWHATTNRPAVEGYGARTTANVAWTATAWVAGTYYPSADLTDVIEEIVARAGWASNNHLSLLLGSADSGQGTASKVIRAWDYAGNASGPKFNCTYWDAPVAAFTAAPSPCKIGETVQFTDTSTNNPTTWDWDWGDGTAHGSTQNPTHAFGYASIHPVTLTASNPGGSDPETNAVIVSSPVSLMPIVNQPTA
jgi:PKD repeat protein